MFPQWLMMLTSFPVLISPIPSLEKHCLNLLPILINFNLKSHMWLAAAILNSVVADNKNAGYRNSDFKKKNSPGWCDLVDWVPACELKGRWFHSLSGHMSGLWARSSFGGEQEANNWCVSPSLLLSLKINKTFKKKEGKAKMKIGRF